MLTLETFKKMIAAAAAAIKEKEQHLSELDAASGGDGDHGTAITTAFNAMLQVAEHADFKPYLQALGEAVENEACGSTSTLFGAWLQGLSDAAPEEGAAVLDAVAVAALFKGGLDAISALTRARVGDKTLMDALIPATEELAKTAEKDVGKMFHAAAAAAERGAEATTGMRARFGRAKNLGERSIGARDPGATSMATIFGAFAMAYAE